MRRHFVHFLWGSLLAILGVITVFFISVWNGWVGYMPNMDELSNPIDKFASQVYSSDQQLIGTWNADNNTVWQSTITACHRILFMLSSLLRMSVFMNIQVLTSLHLDVLL